MTDAALESIASVSEVMQAEFSEEVARLRERLDVTLAQVKQLVMELMSAHEEIIDLKRQVKELREIGGAGEVLAARAAFVEKESKSAMERLAGDLEGAILDRAAGSCIHGGAHDPG